MTYEREDYMRRQDAEHDMIRMRDPRYDVRRLASCGTRPKGGDAHAAPALPSDAVGEAETPTPSPIDPLNVEEGL